MPRRGVRPGLPPARRLRRRADHLPGARAAARARPGARDGDHAHLERDASEPGAMEADRRPRRRARGLDRRAAGGARPHSRPTGGLRSHGGQPGDRAVVGHAVRLHLHADAAQRRQPRLRRPPRRPGGSAQRPGAPSDAGRSSGGADARRAAGRDRARGGAARSRAARPGGGCRSARRRGHRGAAPAPLRRARARSGRCAGSSTSRPCSSSTLWDGCSR